MIDAKQYIEDIKNRILNSDKEFTLDGYAGSIEALQKAFPRYGSFLMEFVQNADDAKSKLLKIEIFQNSIRVSNDGVPFSQKDVKSICKVGRSSKTAKDYIGYLGVGFKAVFLISKSPEIYSGEYKFKFDKDQWPNFGIPWQIIPLWIDNQQIELPEGFNTLFNLPLENTELVEKLQDEIKPDHLSNRILLFLRNIGELEIVNHIQKFKRKIVKSEVSKTSDYEMYQIQEYENDKLKNQDQWLIFRSTYEVPENVKQDYITRNWGREIIDRREVLVAFKLDRGDNLVKEEKGTAHIGVFSFLPLKEIPSGLNFLIQADFLTMTGRGELARECLWNNWLADRIYNLIVSKCIPTFLKDKKWKMNFTELLYSSEGGHELFERYIKNPLRTYIEDNGVLVAEDGSIIKYGETVVIDSNVRDLLSEDDLKKLYPNKKILNSNCNVPWEIQSRIKKGPTFNVSTGISYELQELIKLKAQERDIKFFKNFYSKLDFAESTLAYSPLKNQNIILTDNCDLSDSRSIYIKSEDTAIPNEVKENFRIVDPDIIKEPKLLEILKKLGVTELTEEHIQNLLKTKEIPKISKNWESFSNSEKVEKIIICNELWKRGQVDIRDLSFLTLNTKSGKWLKPDQIIFSKEYQPDHQIEILRNEKKLLDLPVDFLSAEFIKGKNEDETRNWHEFFMGLGVDRLLSDRNFKKNIVSRIGIRTALKFEKSKGRDARELSRSEEIGGYDIIQSLLEPGEGFGLITSQERYIEVKSSGKPNPDIFLTTKQVSTLKEKLEKYFVYVVKDVLRYPTLCITRGDRLLAISEIKTIIPFNKWDDAKDEEFQP